MEQQTVVVTLSGKLWDRAVDSIGQDHGRAYSRWGDWHSIRVGFGTRVSIDMPRDIAVKVLRYLDSLGRLDGSGMDPDGAAETRAEARAARAAAVTLRRRLDRA